MNRTKMKHYFNLALTLFALSAMASSLFAEVVFQSQDSYVQPAPGASTAPQKHLNARGIALSTKDCFEIRKEIRMHMDQVLVKHKLLSRAIYQDFSFEHDLKITKDHAFQFSQDVANKFGVIFHSDVEINDSLALTKYVAGAIKTGCDQY